MTRNPADRSAYFYKNVSGMDAPTRHGIGGHYPKHTTASPRWSGALNAPRSRIHVAGVIRRARQGGGRVPTRCTHSPAFWGMPSFGVRSELVIEEPDAERQARKDESPDAGHRGADVRR